MRNAGMKGIGEIKQSRKSAGLFYGRTVVALSLPLLLATFNQGCYYDVAEELYPVAGDCDTSNVTYAGTIVPILESNCYICHGAGISLGSVTLEGYDNLVTYVNNGQFSGAINHEPGFVPMPQNAEQLSDCNLAMIDKWISDGAPNN